MKFGWPEPPQKWLTFNFPLVREASNPVCKGPPLWNCGISDEIHFIRQNEILYGVKSVLPFSKLIIGKSQVFFNALVRVRVCDIRKYTAGRHICPPCAPFISNKLNLHRCVCFSHTPTTQKSRLVLGPSPIMALVPFSLTPVYSMLLLILMFLVYDDFGVNHELRGSSSYPESAQNDFSIMTRRLSISIL